MVPDGTELAIVTVAGVGDELAPHPGLTGIIGTRIVVVATEHLAPHTLAQAAGIFQSADVAIIAWGRIQGVDATTGRVAVIGGAHVVIVTFEGPRSLAHTGLATGHGRTLVVVVTCSIGEGLVETALVAAAILRTGVAVVAVLRLARLALSLNTHVVKGARVTIATGPGSRLVRASSLGQADVHGAGIAVVAVEAATPLANAIGASVIDGT